MTRKTAKGQLSLVTRKNQPRPKPERLGKAFTVPDGRVGFSFTNLDELARGINDAVDLIIAQHENERRGK
jgi:hypothetical protein